MLIPFGDWEPDKASIFAGSNDAKNCLPLEGSYTHMASIEPYTNALTTRPIGAVSYIDTSSNADTIVGVASALYQLSAASWSDISRSAGYSTLEGEVWKFIKFGAVLLGTNYNDPIQSFTIGGSGFGDLASAAPKCRYMTTIKDFLVVANTNDAIDGVKTERVWWAAIGDPTNWPTPGTAAAISVQSDWQDLYGNFGHIKAIVGGEYGLIFQENAITRMTYVGSPLIFQFDQVEQNRGTHVAGSVVTFGTMVFYLGLDGFYMFNGMQSVPIGRDKVDKTFWSQVDQTYLDRVTASIDPINSLVLWSYPGVSSSGGKPNRFLIYNWVRQRWAYAEIEHEFIFNGLSEGFTLEELDQFGTLDTLPASLDSRQWAGGSILLNAINTDWKVASFTGSPMTATLRTKEIKLPQVSMLKAVRPVYEDGSATISVYSRLSMQGTPVQTGTTSPNQNGVCDLRVNGQYMSIQAEMNGQFSHAIGIEIDDDMIVAEGNR